jgi:hypothetical protein
MSWLRTRAPVIASATGVGLAAWGLVDPARTALFVPAAVACGLGLWLGRGGRRVAVHGLAAALAAAYAAVALSAPDFGADSPSYYVYLRSAFFDHDLDFANEWAHWEFPERPLTPNGHRLNQHAAGSALLWSPFFVAAHVYVRAGAWLALHAYDADGYSLPYLRAAAWGTATWVVLGLALLARALQAPFGRTVALLAALGTFLASPLPYYVLVQPLMAHGNVFALMCALAWTWLASEREPTAARWATAGLLVGLLAATRWQASIAGVLLVPLALVNARAQALRISWLPGAAGGALVGALPQLVAWSALYGHPLVIVQWAFGSGLRLEQGQTGLNWGAPFFWDVLLSADRGLLSWTPVAGLGFVGLLLLARRRLAFAGGALAVAVLTAWVNASARDWSGADAFGARRFDLVFPLLAFGLAELLRLGSAVVERRPWLPAAAGLAALVAWNAGLVRLYRLRVFKEAAPLERVAEAQAHQVRVAGEAIGERVGGWSGRDLAYRMFVGEYLYWNLNPGGTIDLADPDTRYLADGWSSPRNDPEGRAFRVAYHPRACVRIPLRDVLDLRMTVTAKAPAAVPGQTIALAVNGAHVESRPLPSEWTDTELTAPARHLHRGENVICLEFGSHARGPEGSRPAASVSRIQLP